jgi:hypothetical protein
MKYGQRPDTKGTFRIGGTSMFLANGVDPKVVQSLGRCSQFATSRLAGWPLLPGPKTTIMQRGQTAK